MVISNLVTCTSIVKEWIATAEPGVPDLPAVGQDQAHRRLQVIDVEKLDRTISYYSGHLFCEMNFFFLLDDWWL